MSPPSHPKARPLSPHLSVYRPQWTSGYSILHRLTGIVLSLGTLLIAAWLMTLAINMHAFNTLNALMGTWLGILVMLGFLFALYYHLLNGIRHLVWDIGHGFDLRTAQISGHLCGIFALIFTAVSAFFLLS